VLTAIDGERLTSDPARQVGHQEQGCESDVSRRSDPFDGFQQGALAEELGVYRVATRDVRHFSAVRTRRGRRFDLAVQPVRPEARARKARR